MVSLSTTEAEYIALSKGLRETIPMMELIQELNNQQICTYLSVAKVHCKAFEDNSGAVELARMPKTQSCTKHINHVYHHFCTHIKQKLILIHQVKTNDQIAVVLTKLVSQNIFQKLRKLINGWQLQAIL